MKSRLLAGVAVLCAVAVTIGGTAGRSWPGGGTQQGRKQPSMAISANDLMWTFFSSL